ncbi:MAG: hypothetical protein MZV64_62435 [Ignavibacteriales bacterium]|nr:hypothetical protein [Ignavibacteriales bacterium]
MHGGIPDATAPRSTLSIALTQPGTSFMNISFKSYWDLLSRPHPPAKGTVCPAGRPAASAASACASLPRRSCARFIDPALAGEALQTLTCTAMAFIGVALLQQVVAVSVTYLGENVAWTATNALRAELA